VQTYTRSNNAKDSDVNELCNETKFKEILAMLKTFFFRTLSMS